MELKDRIVNRALELFMKYGIRSVTMDQVSGQLGISKRTLYETFRDKNELLRECIGHLSRSKSLEARQMVRDSENVIKTIYSLARKGEELKQKINPLFFEDMWKYYPELHKEVTKESRYRDTTLTLNLLKNGISDGIFKEGLDVDLVNTFFHQVMNIIMNEELFPRDTYAHADIFRNIIMPYLEGISTLKGKKEIEKYFKNEIR
jgi:AcrR family transcriptional regulator